MSNGEGFSNPHGWFVGIPFCGPDPALRLNANSVVHGSADPLLASKVSLCSLHRHMTKKELNLLQLATGGVTKFGTGSTKIMWG